MVRMVQYLNSLVTTSNLGIDASVPDSHPCQKHDDELQDDLQDYIELINKLQHHTRCSSSYCLHINHADEQYCQFGYSKEIVEHIFICNNGWHANVDLKPVLSTYAALQYISKYASKSELHSEAFSKILNQILCNSNSNDSLLAIFQRLLLHTVAEHDISAQETCHLLLGIPLYYSSYQFVSLNFNKNASRVLCSAGNKDEFSINNNIGKTFLIVDGANVKVKTSYAFGYNLYLSTIVLNVKNFVPKSSSSCPPIYNIEDEFNDKEDEQRRHSNLNIEDVLTSLQRAHYIAATVDHNNIEPLRIIIIGTAETRKSYLIKAVVARLNVLAKNHGVKNKLSVLLLVPTEVAAYNIHRMTIYSALFIPVNCTNFDLNSECLKQLQNKLQDVKYFIIDEKSMSVILISDFGQLLPVLNDPIYISTLQHNSLSNNGIIVYKQFLETLTTWLTNLSRVDNSEFLDATHILPRKTDIDKVNFNKLKALNCFVAKINAHHAMGGCEASKADSNTAKGLEPYLLLARNAYKAPSCLSSVLLVKFEDYSGPLIIIIEDKRLAIMIHKSQGLMLAKSKIDLGKREYAAGLSFVAVS
ncbi:14888_t:CDS:10 [Cetraspora pellucida]|uniref:14888_t:CDS:1 n=1 Tax=Cetraspora pellucida TaxID=1433469 RepID=A0A9N9HRN6_9GLOM|nr:14888_t:CDS:10 [Cetraspora pellucida]